MRVLISKLQLRSIAFVVVCLSIIFCFQKPIYAQCSSPGYASSGCGPYRATSYDDQGTDDPAFWDGWDESTTPDGVIASPTYSGRTDGIVNAADYYENEGGGEYTAYHLTGKITYSNFGSLIASSDLTLNIPYSLSTAGMNGAPNIIVTANIGGTAYTIQSGSIYEANPAGTWTLTIPSGTNLADVQVTIEMQPVDAGQDTGLTIDPEYEMFDSLSFDLYIN